MHDREPLVCDFGLAGRLDEACPEPTGEERTKLAQWIACEKLVPR